MADHTNGKQFPHFDGTNLAKYKDWRLDIKAGIIDFGLKILNEPDPRERDRFDGTAACDQEGHSQYGQVPARETVGAYRDLCKEYKDANETLWAKLVRASQKGAKTLAKTARAGDGLDILKKFDETYDRRTNASKNSLAAHWVCPAPRT